MYQVIIIDEFNERYSFDYYEHQYPSLMELIRHNLGSDIGDCRGRMWCNTCAVEANNRTIKLVEADEKELGLLGVLRVENIRLSCQLFLTKELHNSEWKIIDSRKLF